MCPECLFSRVRPALYTYDPYNIYWNFNINQINITNNHNMMIIRM